MLLNRGEIKLKIITLPNRGINMRNFKYYECDPEYLIKPKDEYEVITVMGKKFALVPEDEYYE